MNDEERELVDFIEDLIITAEEEAPPSEYKDGYLDALNQVQSYTEDLGWEVDGA